MRRVFLRFALPVNGEPPDDLKRLVDLRHDGTLTGSVELARRCLGSLGKLDAQPCEDVQQLLQALAGSPVRAQRQTSRQFRRVIVIVRVRRSV